MGTAVSTFFATTGCGGEDVPPNSVAKVGDTTISTATFDQRLKASAEGESAGGKPIVYEPPDFKRCVAAKRKSARAPEGAKAKSDSALRDECDADYVRLRTQTMEGLIQQEWVRQETGKAHISVSAAEARKEFQRQKAASFSTEKGYKDYLETSGRSPEDIQRMVRVNMLQDKLVNKVTAKKLKVPENAIQDFYSKNKTRLGKPERRNVRVVLAKKQAQAIAAKQAVASGASWGAVAEEYSIDKSTAAKRAKLTEVTTSGDKKIDAVMERSKTGVVNGPIKSQFGWVIFEVEKVFPATVPSLDEARPQVVEALKKIKRQELLDEFAAGFREEYRAKTVCANDYKVASCDNGPESNPTTPEKRMQPPQSQQDN